MTWRVQYSERQIITEVQSKPSPPPVETIKVQAWTDREVAVPKTMPDPITGQADRPTTMIQACALGNVDVPHYCYHPKLPVAGNCRMCLVEYGTPAMGPDRKPVMNPDGTVKIAKSPRPAIACATPISPGMEIYTTTPGVKQMREGVLEFLLINHPLDCPICDQAGECKLQEYSVDYGQAASRFVEEKRSTSPSTLTSARGLFSMTSVVSLCTRCIRFSKEIANDDALGIVNRGSYNTIGFLSRQGVRQQLHAQHGGHLPGRGADVEGFPVPDAGMVPEGNQERMHKLRDRVAISLSASARARRSKAFPLSSRAKMTPLIPAGCAIPAV